MKKSVEDRVEGRGREAKGRIKQEVGRVTRNRSMQAKGAMERVAGKAQQARGRVKSKMEKKDTD